MEQNTWHQLAVSWIQIPGLCGGQKQGYRGFLIPRWHCRQRDQVRDSPREQGNNCTTNHANRVHVKTSPVGWIASLCGLTADKFGGQGLKAENKKLESATATGIIIRGLVSSWWSCHEATSCAFSRRQKVALSCSVLRLLAHSAYTVNICQMNECDFPIIKGCDVSLSAPKSSPCFLRQIRVQPRAGWWFISLVPGFLHYLLLSQQARG